MVRLKKVGENAVIKKLLAIFTVAIVGKELYFCILDKILHTTLFLSLIHI